MSFGPDNRLSSFSVDRFLSSIGTGADANTFNPDYYRKHAKRFRETERLLRRIRGQRALEIGATDFFQILLSKELGFSEVWGTIFSDVPELKLYDRQVNIAGLSTISRTVSVDIERELFPVADSNFDLVMMCEVIEHLDIDPMFALVEFNRILAPGGHLLITTPNCCSARNTMKILRGYRPHFFMQYERSRSPFRHNIEYDVHALNLLLTSAGFRVDHLATHDVFEDPVPDTIEFLRRNNLPTDHRGDDIFIVATKVGPVTNRWPDEMYV